MNNYLCILIDTVRPLIPISSVSETILYSSSLEICKFSRIYCCYDLKVMFLYIDLSNINVQKQRYDIILDLIRIRVINNIIRIYII